MFIKSFFSLIFLNIPFFLSICVPRQNHCDKCNPITKLCIKCDKDIYIPNEKGGCDYAHKCIVGINQCLQCDEENKICKQCFDGYYPDENGGCAYIENCELSYRGECLKCKDNYILVGEKINYGVKTIKICKSLYSEDLKNCQDINETNGVCEKCKEGYYLNSGDSICTKTDNCYESIFGICTRCNYGLYLDKKELKCKNQTGIFENCKESFNGEACDVCADNNYFDEEGKCIAYNFCLKTNKLKCEKCAPGYYLNEYNTSCTTTKNCYIGDKDIGICSSCKDGHYLDLNDGKCKSNQENNEFKYCIMADEGICTQCINSYELGVDHKCSTTRFCSESENGNCLVCTDNYYLGLDNKCSDIEHCIYSDFFTCIECEDNYYFDKKQRKCIKAEGNFQNCKSSYSEFYCDNCKNDYYLNFTDDLCYSNKEKGLFYKCAKTDIYAEYCGKCIDGYYLGVKDSKCTSMEGCALSEDDNICIECEESYCMDAVTRKCIVNDEIISEEKKFYFRCNITNEEGNKCEICEEGLVLNEKGLCVDYEHCEEKNDQGNCVRCLNENQKGYYCLNKDFGCIDIYYMGCLECNDNLDFANCTKCFDGYTLNNYGTCLINY